MDNTAKIQNAIQYIEDNLCENIKLNDLAKQVYFSKFHFHRLFHNIVGEPIMEYVRKRRLTEAAKELSESKESITNIALKYQFGSEESFSRAFKRIYGVTPREFRNSKTNVIYQKKIYVTKTDCKTGRSNRNQIRMAA